MIRRTICLTLVAVAALLACAVFQVGGVAQAAPPRTVPAGPSPSRTGTLLRSGDSSGALAPVIYRFTPTAGRIGRGVTIRGIDLSNATSVTFNGKPAVIVRDGAKRIRAIVPADAATGPIRVTTAGGTVASAEAFLVVQNSPH